MLHKGIRFPSGAKTRPCATPRTNAPRTNTAAPIPAPTSLSRNQRPTVSVQAVSSESVAVQDESARVNVLRLAAEAETVTSTPMVNARFLVPYFVTKPGQQLFLTGCIPELGGWDSHLAVPLEWKAGHQHVALVRLPVSRIVQVKLMLKENGQPVFTEEGDAREVMLMPVNDGSEGYSQPQQAGQGLLELTAAAHEPGAASVSMDRAAAGPAVDYQIMCHFGNPDATQILRLPIVLPPKEAGDRRVLCKFVVMLDQLKLEPRQFPVVVGSCEELGAWKAESGVKLIRQVGGYWTRRVELPLLDGPVQAKVVICNPDGQAAAWEPGTANRVLAPSQQPPAAAAVESAMHIFVCRWSQPDNTAVVSVPVEYERADKEFIKQLDAAQREVELMRRAVTAKSRQCQSLESELSTSRRAERVLREEVAGLRSEIGYLMQEMEVAQRGELAARHEAAELQRELQQLGEGYERQISFMEAKLDEMEMEISALQRRLAANPAASTSEDGTYWSSPTPAYEKEAPRVFTRANWR
ncbi:hypothetical protein Vretimale_2128 [Volvox reticuliferus]|uniref:Uncharacterized protein n=1 Tax=Volvox reticuliferus TaxID=1737510 RepID=A0A8J4D5X6_9CHLO|nr:hypothetical protein Vretifemale_4408 [Volvox reticuliferus]GIL96282.1 hypothetical protein Vretimale_2128 [Volvox reticuliferus]